MSIYIVITKDLEVKYAGTDINAAAAVLDVNQDKYAQVMDVKANSTISLRRVSTDIYRVLNSIGCKVRLV